MAQLSEGEYPIFHVNARIILSLSAGIDIKKKKNLSLDFTCFTFQLFHDLDQSQHSEDPQFLLQYYLNFNQSWQEHGGLSRQWWKFPCENAVKGFYRGNVSLQACYRNSPTAPARNNPRICLCCLLIGFKLHFHLNIFLAVMTRLSDGNISVRYSCYGQ